MVGGHNPATPPENKHAPLKSMVGVDAFPTEIVPLKREPSLGALRCHWFGGHQAIAGAVDPMK